MKTNIAICVAMLLLLGCASTSENVALSARDEPLLGVTPRVEEYSSRTVSPRINDKRDQDNLTKLLIVSKILIDSQDGVSINKIEPGKFMIYNTLSNVGLGAVSTIGLSPVQKQTLQRWHKKYMQPNPADVFFGPSADEIIGTRAAFGCTHYARAFIAVVKALGLISRPEDLRYVIASKADDYNRALENQDVHGTINGHQFVIVRVDSRWMAINTSKGQSAPLPAGFDPDSYVPPHNIPIRFQAYPDFVFLLRRIGADWDDGCGDNSLTALMNISRSGTPDNPAFRWEAFTFED
ncbi:MAG: hypothetical protein SWE60_01400 [Thermodesulfobacteriota bacterium]|nr:hypothetical protein [Thermodesulfobacteriota bacterium]